MNTAEEFFLMANIKDELPTDGDEDTYSDLRLRAYATHALLPDQRDIAREMLDIFGTEPDDEMVFGLLAEWRAELNKARPIYMGRGRKPAGEMDYLKYQLYLIAEEENPATVRGMYYRAVSRGIVPKTDSGYDLVQRTLLGMRREGLLPWFWITDTSRRVWGYRRFGDMKSYAKHVAANYRADYWTNSPVNVEIWCEKDAMQGVLAPVVIEEFGLNLYVSKGQSSESYIYEAAEELRADGRPTVVYVLSDFDPAGFRIADVIDRKLGAFLEGDVTIEAHRIAVTHQQIVELALPTRSVKRTDHGAPAFMARYGDVSAELEAMPPNLLRQLVREKLESHMDANRLRTLKLAEQQEREGLKKLEDLLKGAA
jgi:hypothetical protein